jgi:MFS family permease
MQAKTPRLRRIQWVAVTFLTLAGLVNYLDRSTLSIANHSVSGELGLSASQMGLLLSAFSFSYAFAQLPMGALLDRFGARLMLGVGMFVWSVAQFFGGLVQTLQQFLIARICLGIGEAPQFPAGAKVVSEWYALREPPVFLPPHRRSARASHRPFSPACCSRSAGAGCSS